jgi:hypothetical protein
MVDAASVLTFVVALIALTIFAAGGACFFGPKKQDPPERWAESKAIRSKAAPGPPQSTAQKQGVLWQNPQPSQPSYLTELGPEAFKNNNIPPPPPILLPGLHQVPDAQVRVELPPQQRNLLPGPFAVRFMIGLRRCESSVLVQCMLATSISCMRSPKSCKSGAL